MESCPPTDMGERDALMRTDPTHQFAEAAARLADQVVALARSLDHGSPLGAAASRALDGALRAAEALERAAPEDRTAAMRDAARALDAAAESLAPRERPAYRLIRASRGAPAGRTG